MTGHSVTDVPHTNSRWIIGRGLLGAAVDRVKREPALWYPINWADAAGSIRDLRSATRSFLTRAQGDWEIYWCAGRTVTSSTAEEAQTESEVFEAFLQELAAQPPSIVQKGRIFLASSVGGAYAGSSPAPFSETTRARPLSAYGDLKIRMEGSLGLMTSATGTRAFVARITNLFGPGQDLAKGQGLISVIVESYVTGRPAMIYVPLDTLRDYIYADDCARVIDAGMARLLDELPGTMVTKVVGSMNAVSIGAIIGEMSRLRRKPVPIVIAPSSAVGQARDLRVRSQVWTDLDSLVSTTLPEGLGALYRAQLRRHMISDS